MAVRRCEPYSTYGPCVQVLDQFYGPVWFYCPVCQPAEFVSEMSRKTIEFRARIVRYLNLSGGVTHG